jgi:hypothetical protein
MNTTAALEALATKAAAYDPSYTGSGEPVRKASRIINNHYVLVMVIGWEARVEVQVDKSTEALTISTAVELIAA